MIYKAQATAGYAVNLPAFKNPYTFKPGLNILFGPNGCGKTTMIKILGAYSGTKAGWSRFLDPYIRAIGSKQTTQFPERFAEITPSDCKGIVEWDGTASFLMTPETGHALEGVFDDSQDGLLKMDELVGEMVNRPSEGESRIVRLGRLIKGVKNIPDLTKRPENYGWINDVWKESINQFIRYVRKLPRKGPATLLLDEIDRSLSIPNQVYLWMEILPAIAKDFQVIIATHCEYAFLHTERIIEMVPGYVEECKKWIAKARK